MEKHGDWKWYDGIVADKEHSITLAFIDWIGVHGALRIALRNPKMAKHPRQIAEKMVERIEELFGNAGMTQTELDQLYWAETGCGHTPKARRGAD